MELIWNPIKNAELKERYGFGFERIVVAIAEGAVLDVRDHPNRVRYAHQKQYVLEIGGYAWVVPFVSDGETVFLKTIFPSRTATKEFLGDRDGKG